MMKKMAALLILSAVVFSATSFIKYAPPQKAPGIHTIILDAGHGGFLHGTKGLISREQDVTLDITLKLGEAIKKEFPDVKVVYTRTSDATVRNGTNLHEDLHARAAIANEAKGDLFISIHCDATPHPPGGYYEKRIIGHRKKVEYVGKGKKKKKKLVNAPIYESYWVKNMVTGASVYLWKADRNVRKGNAIDTRGEDEGSDVQQDSAVDWDTESPEARIRAQLYEQKYFKKSAMFGSFIEDEFEKAGRHVLGVLQRVVGIGVLEATGMPSVLIETGYLTNKEEEEYLNSEKGQDEVVQNILDALKRYKQQVEGVKAPATTSATDSSKQ
jgi:N-acetylmuramoyl-L-alanine amidase